MALKQNSIFNKNQFFLGSLGNTIRETALHTSSGFLVDRLKAKKILSTDFGTSKVFS